MSLLLTNSTVIDGTGADPVSGSVAVEGSVIESVGTSRGLPGATVLDLSGLTVLPGLIDLHSHMGLISTTNAESLAPDLHTEEHLHGYLDAKGVAPDSPMRVLARYDSGGGHGGRSSVRAR